MNTFGLFSVNVSTFNLKWHTNYIYPQEGRDLIVTLLRVHNLFLNILGYLGGRIAIASGILRILSGVVIVGTTLAIGDRNAQRGAIIGHWYDEAIMTGIAQISRGILEAFIPYGRAVNAGLDTISTVINLTHEISNASACAHCMGYMNHGPYPEPDYSFPLSLLKFV